MLQRLKFSGTVFGLAGLILLLCGCHADIYYQNRAIERAREYLLKNSPDLTIEERSHIRYTSPVLLHGHIIGGTGIGSANQLKSEKKQICVAWQIPGESGLRMVYGVSDGRMSSWYPERVILKQYSQNANTLKAMADQALKYARNNMFEELSPRDMNIIRFTAPALRMTNFEMDVTPPENLSAEEKAAFESTVAKKIQLTLTWDLEDRTVYFCGIGFQDLSGWQIERAGYGTAEELESRTIRTVLTPEQSLKKLPLLVPRSRIGCTCEDYPACREEGICRNPAKKTAPTAERK